MKNSVRAASVLFALILGLTACGGGGGDDDNDKDASPQGEPSSTVNSTGATDESTDQIEGESDGNVDQEGFTRGASTAEFCDALSETDDAIDEAEPGNDDHWLRIVAAFDNLYEVGVAEDLPEAGIEELDQVDILVRQSNSVEEFAAAGEADPPATDTIDDYIDDHCK